MTKEAEIIKELETLYSGLRKTAWVPVLGKKQTKPKGSHYAGLPWFKNGESWPEWERKQMEYLIGLDLSTLPKEITKTLDLHEGVVQLFLGEGYSDDYEDSEIRIINPDQEKGAYFDPEAEEEETVEETPAPEPANPTEYLFQVNVEDVPIRKAKAADGLEIVSWKEIDDYPFPFTWDFGIKNENETDDPLDYLAEKYGFEYVEDVYDIMHEHFPCYDGDKLGGYPYWTQDDETPIINGEKMEFLFQLSYKGNSNFDYDGTGHIFYLPSNPKIMKFPWACT